MSNSDDALIPLKPLKLDVDTAWVHFKNRVFTTTGERPPLPKPRILGSMQHFEPAPDPIDGPRGYEMGEDEQC